MALGAKYSLKERLNLEELYDTLMGLNPRQQLLAAGVVLLVLVLLVVLPVSCASIKLGAMERQISNHEKDVEKIINKIEEFKKAQAKFSSVEATVRPKSEVKLTTRLEALATQSGIGANIDSLKERPSSASGEDFEELGVDVRMSRLSLAQLVEFLHTIEAQSDLSLHIGRLELKPRYDNRQLFDANFEVSTLVSSGASASGINNNEGGDER